MHNLTNVKVAVDKHYLPSIVLKGHFSCRSENDDSVDAGCTPLPGYRGGTIGRGEDPEFSIRIDAFSQTDARYTWQWTNQATHDGGQCLTDASKTQVSCQSNFLGKDQSKGIL
jgi:hypothetical protein